MGELFIVLGLIRLVVRRHILQIAVQVLEPVLAEAVEQCICLIFMD